MIFDLLHLPVIFDLHHLIRMATMEERLGAARGRMMQMQTGFNLEKVKSAHAWAGRQVARATKMIREMSITRNEEREEEERNVHNE